MGKCRIWDPLGPGPGGYCPVTYISESSCRVELVLSSNSHRCDLPFARYSRSNGQNLGLKFRIWGSWDIAAKRREDLSGTDMYHHAQFHADRCHRRRDICNRTERKSKLRTLPYYVLLDVKKITYRKTIAQDVFDRRWCLDGVKTLIKISVRDL